MQAFCHGCLTFCMQEQTLCVLRRLSFGNQAAFLRPFVLQYSLLGTLMSTFLKATWTWSLWEVSSPKGQPLWPVCLDFCIANHFFLFLKGQAQQSIFPTWLVYFVMSSLDVLQKVSKCITIGIYIPKAIKDFSSV